MSRIPCPSTKSNSKTSRIPVPPAAKVASRKRNDVTDLELCKSKEQDQNLNPNPKSLVNCKKFGAIPKVNNAPLSRIRPSCSNVNKIKPSSSNMGRKIGKPNLNFEKKTSSIPDRTTRASTYTRSNPIGKSTKENIRPSIQAQKKFPPQKKLLLPKASVPNKTTERNVAKSKPLSKTHTVATITVENTSSNNAQFEDMCQNFAGKLSFMDRPGFKHLKVPEISHFAKAVEEKSVPKDNCADSENTAGSLKHPLQQNIDFEAIEESRKMILGCRTLSPHVRSSSIYGKLSLHERPSMHSIFKAQMPQEPMKEALKAIENLIARRKAEHKLARNSEMLPRSAIKNKTPQLAFGGSSHFALTPYSTLKNFGNLQRNQPQENYESPKDIIMDFIAKRKAKNTRKVTFKLSPEELCTKNIAVASNQDNDPCLQPAPKTCLRNLTPFKPNSKSTQVESRTSVKTISHVSPNTDEPNTASTASGSSTNPNFETSHSEPKNDKVDLDPKEKPTYVTSETQTSIRESAESQEFKELGFTGAKPKTTTIEPNFTGFKPKSTSIEPNFTGAKPQTTTIAPHFTGAIPKTTTIAPHFTRAIPKTTTIAPAFTGAKPKTATIEADFIGAKPKITTEPGFTKMITTIDNVASATNEIPSSEDQVLSKDKVDFQFLRPIASDTRARDILLRICGKENKTLVQDQTLVTKPNIGATSQCEGLFTPFVKSSNCATPLLLKNNTLRSYVSAVSAAKHKRFVTPRPISSNPQDPSPEFLNPHGSNIITNPPITTPLFLKTMARRIEEESLGRTEDEIDERVCQKLDFDEDNDVRQCEAMIDDARNWRKDDDVRQCEAMIDDVRNRRKDDDVTKVGGDFDDGGVKEDSKEIHRRVLQHSDFLLSFRNLQDDLDDQECRILVGMNDLRFHSTRESTDPVAKTLCNGDEMHFVPIGTEDQH